MRRLPYVTFTQDTGVQQTEVLERAGLPREWQSVFKEMGNGGVRLR